MHPSAAGQAALFAVYRAAMDTILDASRANATGPYETVWPASETNLTTATGIVRRLIVAGIAHTGLSGGVAVSGGDAQVRCNGGSWVAATGRIYNGDVIELKLTTSAAHGIAVGIDLTIGGETRTLSYTTGAAVTPASYAHGGIQNIQPASAVHNWSALAFDHPGIAVLAVKAAGTAPIAIAVAPAGTGDWIAAIRQFTRPVDFQGALDVWLVPIDAAGDHDVRVTYAALHGHTTLSWGVARNADPDPTQVDHGAPANQSLPHQTGSLTVPAGGIAIAVFGEYGGPTMTPATANSGTTAIAEGHGTYQDESHRIALATRITSGAASWNYPFGSHQRGAIVFKAAGT